MVKLKSKPTVEEFSKTYKPFIKACEKAGVLPSKNEASKFRHGIGTAIKFSNEQWRLDPHTITKKAVKKVTKKRSKKRSKK